MFVSPLFSRLNNATLAKPPSKLAFKRVQQQVRFSATRSDKGPAARFVTPLIDWLLSPEHLWKETRIKTQLFLASILAHLPYQTSFPDSAFALIQKADKDMEHVGLEFTLSLLNQFEKPRFYELLKTLPPEKQDILLRYGLPLLDPKTLFSETQRLFESQTEDANRVRVLQFAMACTLNLNEEKHYASDDLVTSFAKTFLGTTDKKIIQLFQSLFTVETRVKAGQHSLAQSQAANTVVDDIVYTVGSSAPVLVKSVLVSGLLNKLGGISETPLLANALDTLLQCLLRIPFNADALYKVLDQIQALRNDFYDTHVTRKFLDVLASGYLPELQREKEFSPLSELLHLEDPEDEHSRINQIAAFIKSGLGLIRLDAKRVEALSNLVYNPQLATFVIDTTVTDWPKLKPDLLAWIREGFHKAEVNAYAEKHLSEVYSQSHH
jgi:hypothetical protein